MQKKKKEKFVLEGTRIKITCNNSLVGHLVIAPDGKSTGAKGLRKSLGRIAQIVILGVMQEFKNDKDFGSFVINNKKYAFFAEVER